MSDTRHKNTQWVLKLNPDGTLQNDRVQIAVLMDIRDELQTLNFIFRCKNFVNLPHTLNRIDRRLRKKLKLQGER